MKVINVEKRSNEYAYYGSFRVTINRADFEKALDPINWPVGWSVREYFHSTAIQLVTLSTCILIRINSATRQEPGIWGFGNLGIWGFGDLEIWGFGDLGIWGFGDLGI